MSSTLLIAATLAASPTNKSWPQVAVALRVTDLVPTRTAKCR